MYVFGTKFYLLNSEVLLPDTEMWFLVNWFLKLGRTLYLLVFAPYGSQMSDAIVPDDGDKSNLHNFISVNGILLGLLCYVFLINFLQNSKHTFMVNNLFLGSFWSWKDNAWHPSMITFGHVSVSLYIDIILIYTLMWFKMHFIMMRLFWQQWHVQPFSKYLIAAWSGCSCWCCIWGTKGRYAPRWGFRGPGW